MGNCLAGETCIFSHDPSKLVSKMSLESGSNTPTRSHSSLMLQDMSLFPSLHGDSDHHYSGSPNFASSPGMRSLRAESPRPRSRPGSRHQLKENYTAAPPLMTTRLSHPLARLSQNRGRSIMANVAATVTKKTALLALWPTSSR